MKNEAKKKFISSEKEIPSESLSIKMVLEFLNNELEKSDGPKADFIQIAIMKIRKLALFDHSKSLPDAKGYDLLFRYINSSLSFLLHGNQQFITILAMPVSPQLIAMRSNDSAEDCDLDDFCIQLFIHDNLGHFLSVKQFYVAIWNKYMRTLCPLKNDLTLPVTDHECGRKRFYNLKLDFRFIDVKCAFTDETCVKILNDIDFGLENEDEILKLLVTKLPLKNFSFDGFRRIEANDITDQYILDNLEKQIIEAKSSPAQELLIESVVKKALYDISDRQDLVFNLMPMLLVNDKYTFENPRASPELNKDSLDQRQLRNKIYQFLSAIYRLEPKRVFLRIIDDEFADKYSYLKFLRDQNVNSYALLPVFFRNSLVGVLEIYTNNISSLSKDILFKIEILMPALAIFFQQSIYLFERDMEKIIWDNFTSIQPSVKWKFNEAAWQYIKSSENSDGSGEMGTVGFDQVYPLYGAVDIKNSSVRRNEALINDLSVNLALVLDTLKVLLSETEFPLLKEKIFLCENWLEKINLEPENVLGTELEDFIEYDLNCFLRDFGRTNRDIASCIQSYFDAVHEGTGKTGNHRKNLEYSMNAVISLINTHIENIRVSAQKDYPCFFEKFRTDGVEYDIYIGQSMSPGRFFQHLYIQNLRLLQLSNMISIAKDVYLLQESLPVAIETTQLIFVHSHYIDILFRKDERRFDVEGAYNIRYQIVKKRIDKVHIKDTSERLTAPEKIAFVFFNQKDAEELTMHIQFLQLQKLLKDDLEILELESLQGVVGLKALRVGIELG
ncbi:hypothetical protein [Dyadobacter frigoris]|uniref:hypothetical protein n=1 Tax=Dyadobacter frigoris TaxID=2576211 RepID=UPI002552E3D1|nr:hypothetical protein [Dyadobacter frigoris]